METAFKQQFEFTDSKNNLYRYNVQDVETEKHTNTKMLLTCCFIHSIFKNIRKICRREELHAWL